jgi:pimeloyl-ACP methyl ester carboxylesterase
LALGAATESRGRPFAPAPLRAQRLATAHGELHARVAPAPRPGAPAVVLIHGVIVSGRYLLPAAAELAHDAAVVVPDLPGHGLSDAPHADTIAALADAAIAAAASAGHRRVALLANSFGSQIATEAAIRHPDAVERLVLIGPTIDPSARSAARQALRWLACAPHEHPSVLPVMARDLADMGPRPAVRLVGVMLRDRIEDRLRRVGQPVLVVRGDGDRIVPHDWAAEVARLLPDGRLAVLPDAGHMPNWSATEALVAVVRDFLLSSARR